LSSESADHPQLQTFQPTEFADFVKEMEQFKKEDSSRRLVILEDLGYDWIVNISSTFKVPMNVFAEHWANPAHHINGRVRVPLGQDLHHHYILNYDQQHAITIPKLNKGTKYDIPNANRSTKANIMEG
jgi:hypothetical protein